MKLTKQQKRILLELSRGPWRLYGQYAPWMEDAGLAISGNQWEDGSRLYTITPAGRAALEAEKENDR